MQVDYRARLQPKDFNRKTSKQGLLGINDPSNILYPLHSTKGVLFPYSPSIVTGSVAEYDSTPFTHSIYGYNSYVRSYPKTITVSAAFTAQSNDEALYLLAVIHFFRTVTKSYFGITPYNKAGTPPPIMLFNYLGEYQFNNVPVIIKEVTDTYEADVDYIPVNTANTQNCTPNLGMRLTPGTKSGYSYVPAHMKFDIVLDTQYIPINIRNGFDLDEFRQGNLLNKGYI